MGHCGWKLGFSDSLLVKAFQYCKYCGMYCADFAEVFFTYQMSRCHGTSGNGVLTIPIRKVLPSMHRFSRNSLTQQIFVDLVHRSSADLSRYVERTGKKLLHAFHSLRGFFTKLTFARQF